MPELPDVENYRRYLTDHGLKREIADVGIGSAKVLDHISGKDLAAALKGRRMVEARRHGKHILASLDDGQWLHFHFGMTGFFAAFDDPNTDSAHDRLRFDFADGGHLAFDNQRLFGRVGLAQDPADFIEEKELGPDALAIDADSFIAAFKDKRGQVKAALMDQSLLAGIGNIYSDEILYDAKRHPKTPVPDLDEDALETLYKSMRRVLEMAIERGAGFEGVEQRVPDTWLLPHRQDGESCRRCGGTIRSIKIQSRTAYYCPDCQPAP